MGDVILKKIILLLTIFMLQHTLLAQTNGSDVDRIDVSEYDDWFNEINNVRVGVSELSINKLTNPFITITTPSTSNTNSSAVRLELNAIMDGDNAMINKKWYKINSLVNNMRLTSIKKDSVVLRNAERSIELYLRKKNENSIIKTY